MKMVDTDQTCPRYEKQRSMQSLYHTDLDITLSCYSSQIILTLGFYKGIIGKATINCVFSQAVLFSSDQSDLGQHHLLQDKEFMNNSVT